jgi:hypothetical protein
MDIFLSLRRKPQLRPLSIKHHILTLQKHIAQDREGRIGRLNAAETLRTALRDGDEVDQTARDDGLVVVVDEDGEVGELGRAVEDVAAGGLVELGAVDGLVVCGSDVLGDED